MPRLSKIGAAALAAFGWTGLSSVSASYLVVAGGGGGAEGGGGAGGYLTGTASLNPTLSYTVTVGAGGTAGSGTSTTNGGNGGNSVFNSVTSTGGGGGATGGVLTGLSGGSGGGGSQSTTSTSIGGAGTSGQGNNGGTNGGFIGSPYPAGGGGGAGAVGGNGTSNSVAGNGGAGTASSISGSSVTYAGGGGGGVNGSGTGGSGGSGGGGAGSSSTGTGTSGTANLGGGGGGTGTGGTGGSGGSGVVVISYPAPQQFGGGVVTTSGSNVIHTFNTSGTLSPLSSLTASYLIVAGGAGSGYSNSAGNSSGGGGAGGLLSGSGLTIDANSIYLVTVGAGGAGSTVVSSAGSNGSISAFSMVSTSASGGGGGGSSQDFSGAQNGQAGASGGGGGGNTGTTTGGAGTSGQGFAGGAGEDSAGSDNAGGGGGAGGIGAAATSAAAGNGGIGATSSISGTSTYYAGGGGGGAGAGTVGDGGSGGGGAGVTSGVGVAGTANTGGGAGGSNSGNGASGGSGVVIISYAGSTQQMAGGTVTISGGNVIHTFTSSGYLTPIKLVNNSLRFRSSATAYLNRTFSTPTNQKVWTWSGWIKRGALTGQQWFFGAGGTSNPREGFNFLSDNTLDFTNNTGGSPTFNVTTTQVFRDPAAWYHIIIAFDSTQATASNRIKMYVNGTQVTSFSTASYPSLNANPQYINSSGTIHNIGALPNGTGPFDGYMAEVNFIDGQALTPNSFGTFNSYGVWQPITYGGSYGTNGFYLPFSNTTSATTLAYDFSPNGNNWTPNNISTSTGSTYDSMTDVPTLTSATAANYAVLNPLDKSTRITLSNGNLTTAFDQTANHAIVRASMGMTTGKFYWEVTVSGQTGSAGAPVDIFGVQSAGLTADGTYVGQTGTGMGWGYNTTNSAFYASNFTTSGTPPVQINGTMSVAYDADNGLLWFASAGTYIQGNPATGSSPSGTRTGANVTMFPAVSFNNTTTGTWNFNFGQRPFSYTPPTGYVALNTYNL